MRYSGVKPPITILCPLLLLTLLVKVGGSEAFSLGGGSWLNAVAPTTTLKSLWTDENLDGNENLDSTEDEDEDCVNPCFIPSEFVAESNLPTDWGHFRMRAYRITDTNCLSKFSGTEPVIIFPSNKPPGKLGNGEYLENVHVRIHDQCVTSEVFGSRRCDCRDQLIMAFKHIRKHGGAVIYLQQEGRGIGLANKVAAYALQDTGLDTVEANVHLGFPEDARSYGVVPGLLRELGIKSIKLMTNNPMKVDYMRKVGVKVEGTIPMVVEEVNQWNRKYLETKVERMGHANFNGLTGKGTFVLPALRKNGMMIPNNVKHNANSTTESPTAESPTAESHTAESHTAESATTESDTAEEDGVVAGADGYCFGKHTVTAAIDAISRGEMVVVVDDMDRENEGDFIFAAEKATPENMAVLIRYSSGVICVAMNEQRLGELELPSMVDNNQDPKNTAFTVSVDAVAKHGITTGISARDRAKTLQLLADSATSAEDYHRPGHIFPLKAQPNGVLDRDGHTEAAIDFSRLAGCTPVGVLCEIVSEEQPTEMARLPELRRFCAKHGFVLTSIADLKQYRIDMGL